jgi:hypothetical protein
MNSNALEIQKAATVNVSENKSVRERFVVFVAGGRCPIISFENYQRAERMAVFFADLTNVRMEVFDSVKEICYFISPCAASQCVCPLNFAV